MPPLNPLLILGNNEHIQHNTTTKMIYIKCVLRGNHTALLTAPASTMVSYVLIQTADNSPF